MPEAYKSLRGFANSQDATLSNILLENFITFYDWGLVDKGDFYNIDIKIIVQKNSIINYLCVFSH